MSQTKAQLIQPIGVVTAGGVVVTGVVTASSFTGDVVGSATSIISGGNLNLGDVNATTFSGDFTGTATGINTGADIKVGQFTASSFTGDFTGTATSMFRGTGFKAGAVNATGFNVSGTSAGNITGNVIGNITGNVTGVSTGNVTGNVTGNITGYAKSVTSGANIHVGVLTAISFSGDGSNLSGIAATNYNTQVVPDNKTFSIDVGNSGSSAYTLSGTDRNGSVSGNNASVSVEVGDTLNFVVDASGHPFYIRVSDGGANVSTPAATNQGTQSGTVSWTPNTAGTYYYQCGNHSGMIGTITVTATTTIDLSAGNMITFNQSADTTISFASTDTAMDITIIRKKDDNSTARTITWPDSVKWTGGTAPTLISSAESTDFQQFQFITRDAGLTWYAWENTVYNPPYINLFSWGFNNGGNLGLNQAFSPSTDVGRSSPTQVGTDADWGYTAGRQGALRSGAYSFNMQKSDSTWWGMGVNRYNELASPSAVFASISAGSWPHGVSSPTQMFGGDTNFVVVENNQRQGAAIKTDGTLWMMGRNDNGNLGQNNLTSRSSPVQIPGTTWYDVGMGYAHTFATKTDGSLWAWGYNGSGQLGQNNQTSRSSPTRIGTNTNWGNDRTTHGMKGTAGSSYAVKNDGTLWSWGQNVYGNLGHNNQTNYSSPKQVPGTWTTLSHNTYAHIIQARKNDGTLWFWGVNNQGQVPSPGSHRSSPVQQGTKTDWALGKHDASNTNAGGVDTSGNLYLWGKGGGGELGDNSTTPAPGNFTKQIPGTWKNMRLSWDACIATKEP